MLETLKLRDFRNHGELELRFTSGINLVVGANGIGKTNLLEAVFFLLEGRPMRGASVQDLIRNGADTGCVEGVFNGGRREEGRVVLKKEAETVRKRFEGSAAVAFIPEDVFLIKGNPEWRRRFVDETVKACKPSYTGLLREYGRTLRQRNQALRLMRKDPARLPEVRSWNFLLVRQGTEIVRERREALLLLRAALEREAEALGLEGVEVRYYSSFDADDEDANLRKVGRIEEAELRRGVTLCGPHRDEVVFYVSGRNLRKEGSQGEQKLLSLACKMAQASVIEDRTSKKVVLLLDDCFSELDAGNRDRLTENLRRREQVLVTATDRVVNGADNVIELERMKG